MLPGSVRLTDPRRLTASSAPAQPAAATPVTSAGPVVHPVVDAAPAETAAADGKPAAAAAAAAVAGAMGGKPAATQTGSVGPGWWSGVKDKLVELGEKATEANRTRATDPLAAQVVTVPQSTPEPQAPVIQPELEPQAPIPQSTPELPAPVIQSTPEPQAPVIQPISEPPRPAGPQFVAAAAATEETTQPKSGRPQPEPRSPRPKEVGELNLWDDYGIADAHEWYEIATSAPPRERVNHLLGASVVPTAKTFSFLLVLGGAVVMLLVLVSLLLNLDKLFFAPRPSEATPTSPATTASAEPTTEPEPQTEEPAPPAKRTPEMLPGAKECLPGVWAGPQTSCPLAEAVATQVDLKMTDSRIVEAYSSITDRSYRLECVANGGITCTGLEGVAGVYVWFVTES